MEETSLPLYIGVETVRQDLGVSRAKAYSIIKTLNDDMKAEQSQPDLVRRGLPQNKR